MPRLQAGQFLLECEALVPFPSHLIAYVMEVVENAIGCGEVAEIDTVLAKADLDVLGVECAIGMLTITLSLRRSLPSRQDFVRRTKELMMRNGEGAEEIGSVLHGLE